MVVSSPIIIKDLSKSFGNVMAVDKISFDVSKGEIFGLLGPNGAGKTTIIKILVTLLHPTSGTAYVAGYRVDKRSHQVRQNIGIVFQEPTLDLELTARENLDFHARLYGMSRKKRESRINEVLELVELSDRKNEVVKNFSGGMQRRLEIARGLMHFPAVLFLDEPTLGLDVQTRRRIWEYIVEMGKKEGITIVLTTHYIEEADRLCDRVAIIDHGNIIAVDTPTNLKKSVGGDVISLSLSKEEDKVENTSMDKSGIYIDTSSDNISFSDFEQVISKLKAINGIKDLKEINGKIELSLEKGEEKIPEIVNAVQSAGTNLRISSINMRRPTLEDVFIKFTGRKMRDNGEPMGVKPWLARRRT